MQPLRILAVLLLSLCVAAPAQAVPSQLHDQLAAAADRGSAEAAYHLGMIHHLGLEGVARDPRRALNFFRRAADGGDPLGAYKVGCFYAGQGEGVVEDDEELALRYKLIAAEAGYALAQIDVARIYAQQGNLEQSLHWLDAAARQGEPMTFTMALMQVMPGGPQSDPVRAWLYFRVLERAMEEAPADVSEEERRQLREDLAPMRQMIAAELSPAGRAEAERELTEWRTEPSPVTLRAHRGLDAARHLVDPASAE